jgi:1-acyl-sn-glycerol-3-phosphate acyltransferase
VRTLSDYDPDRLDAREPALVARLLPWFTTLCERYFRLRVEGLEHVGDEPLILAGNHNNGIVGPEVAATFVTLLNRRGPEAPIYALAHDFAMRQLTPFGALLQRLGGVRATPENARRILAAGGQVIVYPGGDLEAYRPTRRRDEIILGERTGFIRIAQETGAPIVPVVAHGAHRSAYIFTDGEAIARVLQLKRLARIERFPLGFALPWGFTASPWVPYLPLPFQVRLRFLPPVRVGRHEDAVSAREHLRRRMQAALDEMAQQARLRNA